MTLLLLAACVLLAFTVEAITGFGSIVIAVSLASLFMPLESVVPVVVPLNVVMSSLILRRHYQHIEWPLLLKRILPLMFLGTVIGYLAMPWLGDASLKIAFGILVIWFAAREWWKISHQQWQPLPSFITPFIMTAAGITHGLFASGGPLLVYALAGTQLPKEKMRATLISVWWTLNLFLTLAFLIDGRLQQQLSLSLALLLCLPVAILLGNYWHQRLNEMLFKKVVYAVLIVAGGALVVSGVRG